MASTVLSTQKPHAVAVPLPAQGHLNPLMRFCKVLASQGFRVTFVNIDPVHHRIAKLNQHEDDEGEAHEQEDERDEGIRRAHIPVQGLDLANDFSLSFEHFYEALKTITPHLEDLIHKLNQEGPPVTCLISDFFITLPTQKVADKFSVPRIAFFPSSASTLLLFRYVLQGEHISTKGVIEACAQRGMRRAVFCEGLPGLPTLNNNDLPHCKHLKDDSLYIWELISQSWHECSSRAHAIGINSFQDLEPFAFKALKDCSSPPIYAVGPLIEPLCKESTTSLWKEDDACIHWIDQQPPLSVLYISFGSITILTQPQFQEILDALLSSQQRFLWVFRSNLVENGSYPTLVLDVISKSHGKGFVVDWAPQLHVLSHPSVGGFLTHCGWNSTIEAIAHGVPMLCWPYFGDQFLDAKYVVEEWKIGLQFEASDGCLVKKNEIERVVKSLMEGMEGETLRHNIMCLKEASYQSLLPGGTSYKDIQTLVTSLM